MDSTFFDTRALLKLLRRQLRMVLAIMTAAMLLAVFVIFALRPVYTASSMVLVDPSNKNLLEAGVPRGDISDSSRVDSEVLIAETLDVLEQVAADLKLVEHPEFQPKLGIMDTIFKSLSLREPPAWTDEQRTKAAVAELSTAVAVRRIGVTFVLSISAQSADSALASDIANAVADTYIQLQVSRKVAAITSSRNVIEARVADATAAIRRSEDQLGAFLSEQVAAIANSADGVEVRNLQRQIETASMQGERYDNLLDQVSTGLSADDWTGLAGVIESDSYLTLNSRREQVQTELAASSGNVDAAIDLRTELSALQSSLRAAADAEVNSLSNQVGTSQRLVSDLRDQLGRAVVSANLPPAVLTKIYQLQQTAEISRRQYQVLLERLNVLDTQASLQVPDSTIVGLATVPGIPSFPNTRLFLLVAAALAAGLAVGVAILVDRFIGGFTSAAQLEAVLRTEVVAQVPKEKLARSRGARESIADLVFDAPLSTFSEAIRRIRLGVERAARRLPRQEQSGLIVMVTSAAPAEGKTSLSLSLARSYASAGKKCLIIDCDLRKPSLLRELGLKASDALPKYLSSEDTSTSLDELLERDSRSSLLVIGGSHRPSNSTDQLVTGKTFSRLLSAGRKVFDIIVLDTPPVLPVVDGLYLAPHADVIVFVARWASTSQADAKMAVRLLDEERRPEVEVLTAMNLIEGADVRRSYMDYYQEPGETNSGQGNG